MPSLLDRARCCPGWGGAWGSSSGERPPPAKVRGQPGPQHLHVTLAEWPLRHWAGQWGWGQGPRCLRDCRCPRAETCSGAGRGSSLTYLVPLRNVFCFPLSLPPVSLFTSLHPTFLSSDDLLSSSNLTGHRTPQTARGAGGTLPRSCGGRPPSCRWGSSGSGTRRTLISDRRTRRLRLGEDTGGVLTSHTLTPNKSLRLPRNEQRGGNTGACPFEKLPEHQAVSTKPWRVSGCADEQLGSPFSLALEPA